MSAAAATLATWARSLTSATTCLVARVVQRPRYVGEHVLAARDEHSLGAGVGRRLRGRQADAVPGSNRDGGAWAGP